MKKVFLTLLLLLSLCLLIQPASALEDGQSAAVASAHLYNDKLNAYFWADESDLRGIGKRLNAYMGLSKTDEPSSITRVGGSDIGVDYLLLVDVSTSMTDLKVRQVRAFVSALVSAEKQPYSLALTTFGTEFTVVTEGLDTADEVLTALDKLEYTEGGSDISGGIAEALAYAEENTDFRSSLVNLIVLTDGSPYLNGQELDWTEADAAQLEAMTALTPEVIVHTAVCPGGSGGSFSSLSNSNGINLNISGNAAAAGVKLASFIDGLYKVSFDDVKVSGGQRYSVLFTLTSGNQAEWSAGISEVPVLNEDGRPDIIPDLAAAIGAVEPTTTPEPPASPEPTDSPEPSDLPEPTDSPEPIDTPEPTDSPEPSDIPDLPEPTEPANSPEPTPTPAETKNCAIYIIIVAVLLLTAACLVLLLAKRRHRPRAHSAGGIELRLEPISGSLKSRDRVFSLDGELLIGRDADCDIVFNDNCVSPKNSRVFIMNSLIYIEDLGSAEGTAIEGMRIYAPNRLRSGDEIGIGTVRFRLRF